MIITKDPKERVCVSKQYNAGAKKKQAHNFINIPFILSNPPKKKKNNKKTTKNKNKTKQNKTKTTKI